ncbi:MAG: hypothetical protein WD399_07380 [Thermoleophilaceae bacterium]
MPMPACRGRAWCAPPAGGRCPCAWIPTPHQCRSRPSRTATTRRSRGSSRADEPVGRHRLLGLRWPAHPSSRCVQASDRQGAIPAAWGGQIYDGLPRRLLTIEISLLAGAELPTEALHGEVFGLRFAGPGVGLTRGALIGDKLLTLGPNTTGIRNAHDRIARQLYDLDHLTADGLGVAELRDAATTASYLAPLEAAHRGLDLQALTALEDAIASAVAWGQLGLPSGPDKAVVREIRAWQGANVPLDKQLGTTGWATRALRVSMVADAVRVACEEAPAAGARRYRDQRALLQRSRPAQRAIAQQLGAHIGNGANALASGDPTRTCMLGLHHLGGQAVAELVRQAPDG